MGIVTQMRADLPVVIADFKETVTIKRSTVSYNTKSEGTPSWVTVTTAQGDKQPLSGRLQRAEATLEVKSDAFIILPYNTNIEENDRVYYADGSFDTVNYLRKYNGHITAFMKHVEGVA